ncbi:hypothetical protein MycrhDRAFT_5757 [Mycolicibacterium rhodesiae JS60]|nr:hypothetical protein MycrhDRAFT_5757 [Mycolicibacterium rhodesiae JS60]
MQIGIGTILFIVFMVLKLTSVIDWSWLWVAAPLWIPLSLAGVLYTFGVALTALANKLD